ncbi:MAG: hypothetical protein H6745_14715 [Deltaproteobacteria bacterium]|nr:hypothetical protein [Deltaproteobacteria bacterium]
MLERKTTRPAPPRRKLHAAAVAAVALPLLVGTTAAARAGVDNPVEGVAVVESVVDGADTVSVRVALALGLDAEGEGTWGLSALALAALRDGPTRHLKAGEAVTVAARAGLVTTAGLGRDHVEVTVTGPPEALETALWLAAERLDPRDVEPAELEALHEALVATPGNAPTPPAPPLEHTFANLFGPLGGNTAWASHQRAESEPLDPLAALVADALPRARALVLVAGPARALAQAAPMRARTFASLAPRPGGPPPRRDASLDADWQARRPDKVAARQAHDSRRLVTVAWDLRGLAPRLGLSTSEDDAFRRVLTTLVAAPGGLLLEPLRDDWALVRDVDVLAPGALPAVVVTATVRGRSGAEARARILDVMADLVARGAPEHVFDGARTRALAELTATWGDPAARVALITDWVSLGYDPAANEATYEDIAAALADMREQEFRRWADYALDPSRRVVVELTPTQAPDEERIVLDADTLGSYLRLLVDLRCPPPGRTFELVELLASKYQLTPEEYLALTRVVAREPARMAELNHEAEQRCLEYKKLRGIMPARRVLALHRAVLCETRGLSGDDEDRVLAAVFRRFDLDPSVYRPLLAMSREDPALLPQIERVERECAPAAAP